MRELAACMRELAACMRELAVCMRELAACMRELCSCVHVWASCMHVWASCSWGATVHGESCELQAPHWGQKHEWPAYWVSRRWSYTYMSMPYMFFTPIPSWLRFHANERWMHGFPMTTCQTCLGIQTIRGGIENGVRKKTEPWFWNLDQVPVSSDRDMAIL